MSCLQLKSAQARGKRIDHEGNANFEEDDTSTSGQPQPNEKNLEDTAQQLDAQSHEHAVSFLTNFSKIKMPFPTLVSVSKKSTCK